LSLTYDRVRQNGIEGSSSFLKKRTKKLLSYKGMALRQGARIRKSFCFFFQKEVLSDFGSINVNTGCWGGRPNGISCQS